jgi:heavy metal sensor kinase
MNLRSLVVRLVAWHAVWLAAAFVIAGGIIYFGLRHYLEASLADAQVKRAGRIALVLGPAQLASPGELSELINNDFAPEVSERFIRISRTTGGKLYTSGIPADKSFNPDLISAPPLRAGTRIETLPDGTKLIIAAVVSSRGSAGELMIETGESLMPALQELDWLLATLSLGFVVVSGVAVAGAQRLFRDALRPVDEITARAETITSNNLSDRLPVPSSGVEFERLSQALNRMIQRLEESFQHNRRFLGDASHELRTPLTILRGELEALAQTEPVERDMRAVVGSLLEEVDRLSRIVENLFALSRLESGATQVRHVRLDLAALAVGTAEQMCLLAEDKGIDITTTAPAPVWVLGDPARLRQVVVNLLDNAIKYTADRGKLSLTVKAEGEFAICEVADTGMGIPAEAIPFVFDRFYRVDEARSREIDGAGLGLAIVKSICTAHGGTAEVESTVGQGSRFRIKLALLKS